MFKNYRGLWCILAVALLVFLGVSLWGPIRVGGYELKQSAMADALIPPAADTVTAAGASAKPASAGTAVKKAVETDTAAKTILFIGDSMLEGLGPRMAAYARQNGHTVYQVMWYSSHSKAWGSTDKLRTYIRQLHPDYIFICLGANELFVTDIKKKRAQYVRNMVRDIGEIPFVWIGPPNWKPDTGINQLIAENVPQGMYFKSDGMTFSRSKDGAHPTRESAIEWMDSVARWMPKHSAHPIRMAVPEMRTARPKKIFVHQPSEIP